MSLVLSKRNGVPIEMLLVGRLSSVTVRKPYVVRRSIMWAVTERDDSVVFELELYPSWQTGGNSRSGDDET